MSVDRNWEGNIRFILSRVESELVSRSLPYHGRSHNPYPEYNSKQLDTYWMVIKNALGKPV